MTKDVDMGAAGSLTVALLCIAVAILLRSFYKRYTKLSDRQNESDEN
jgi:cyanate permease